MPRHERLAVGIDLGTTFTCIAAYRNGRAEAIQNDQGNRITPSIVCYHDGEKVVGEGALHQWAYYPENTICDAKRMIGRRYDDPIVQEDLKNWQFEVVDKEGKPNVLIHDQGHSLYVTPEQVSGMVLQKMKDVGEAYLEKPIFDAVITVPAYFTDAQRQATKDAATIAGLNVLRMINEPTAAAIYHGTTKAYKNAQKILVFDLGGGTLDVSILSVEPGMKFFVLGTHGDPHLGGKDFDNMLANALAEEVTTDKKLNLNKEAVTRLREACETAKKSLSFNTSAKIMIPNFVGNEPFMRTLKREEFEEICKPLFSRLLQPVKDALRETSLSAEEIQDVILIGGSSRIVKVKKLVQEFFPERNILQHIHPDESVACGAAVFAASLSGDPSGNAKALTLVDVTPFSLGIETLGGGWYIAVASPGFFGSPEGRRQWLLSRLLYANDTSQWKLSTDDMSMQAFRASPTAKDRSTIWMTPSQQCSEYIPDRQQYSEDAGYRRFPQNFAKYAMTVFFPKNTRLPAQHSDYFTTPEDGQTSVQISVHEGESEIAKENRLLGTTQLFGIESGKRGNANIVVTFEIGPNGILNVSAIDQNTGSKVEIELDNDKYNLSTAEIHRIAGLLSEGTSDDKLQEERKVLIARLKEYRQSIEEILAKNRHKLSDQDYKQATQNLKEFTEWIQDNEHANRTTIILKQQEAYRQFRSVLLKLS
ncbi:heat shock 70 kDa protein-like isoform X2 [Paramacrobiotus metropolitanus]|uniref:heat shock 70 kDa protein-like isoform X2 n=1 Tax=Paramacrobiotus metropolitanus TaxID=2943436 RepID=UPI002445BF8D|nr:heat shock 70 kDa protein-like isoform X2 [Paramacrobiotus metropolitanus]